MSAPLNLSSLYIFEVSYARNTDRTVENRRGLPGISDVKMNSNRVLLHFVRTYNASVCPRNFDFAVLTLTLRTQLYPMERLTLGTACECHSIRRFETNIFPLSPLLPFVSSTDSNLSI